MNRFRLLAASLGTGLVLGACAEQQPAPAAEQATAQPCRILSVPTGIGEATMWGELCVPGSPHGVQLLVHGASYTGDYWAMMPVDHHAYAVEARRAGWATLVIDRPGHGRSAPLLSDQPTAPLVADLLIKLVRELKDGKHGKVGDQVVLVGHSAGTALILLATQRKPELATEVAGLVLTGMVHAPTPSDVVIPAKALHRANTEPRFAQLDDGWTTTVPDSRGSLWWAPDSPPELVRHDEFTKDYFSRPELTGARDLWVTPATVPVPRTLVIAGQLDSSFCAGDARSGRCADDAALLANEQRYFPPGTALTARLVPGLGHIRSSSPEATGFILDWLSKV